MRPLPLIRGAVLIDGPFQVHGRCQDPGSGYARSVVGPERRVRTNMAITSRGVPVANRCVPVGCDVASSVGLSKTRDFGDGVRQNRRVSVWSRGLSTEQPRPANAPPCQPQTPLTSIYEEVTSLS